MIRILVVSGRFGARVKVKWTAFKTPSNMLLPGIQQNTLWQDLGWLLMIALLRIIQMHRTKSTEGLEILYYLPQLTRYCKKSFLWVAGWASLGKHYRTATSCGTLPDVHPLKPITAYLQWPELCRIVPPAMNRVKDSVHVVSCFAFSP